jgi:hypothetical protein
MTRWIDGTNVCKSSSSSSSSSSSRFHFNFEVLWKFSTFVCLLPSVLFKDPLFLSLSLCNSMYHAPVWLWIHYVAIQPSISFIRYESFALKELTSRLKTLSWAFLCDRELRVYVSVSIWYSLKLFVMKK